MYEKLQFVNNLSLFSQNVNSFNKRPFHTERLGDMPPESQQYGAVSL